MPASTIFSPIANRRKSTRDGVAISRFGVSSGVVWGGEEAARDRIEGRENSEKPVRGCQVSRVRTHLPYPHDFLA